MFRHKQTTVSHIKIEGGKCIVIAIVETVKTVNRGPMEFFPGPNILFDITMPASEIEDAYDRAIEDGRRIFERFNAKQEAA